MRLSWNEIRTRAGKFADDWRDAAYEKGETQSFYNDFFGIFDVKRRSVARYEEQVQKLDNRSGFIDLFWPGLLIVEQKSAGRDLTRAYGQAQEYFDALPERDRPRYILVSDFQSFELHDLDEREHSTFTLADLPAHVEKFGFILGVQRCVIGSAKVPARRESRHWTRKKRRGCWRRRGSMSATTCTCRWTSTLST